MSELSPLKRALIAIETLQGRLDEVERARTEPIAIVGMGCRFPGGANSPAEFWHRLRHGADLVSEVPTDRWDVDAHYDPDRSTPGTMSTRCGGFLDQVDNFDPAFFGLSRAEGASMDPQQRLLLEVAWEALEHAGTDPGRLAGTDSDVYVGISTWDYSLRLGGAPIRGLSGTAFSIAANRLSYLLDLHGASMAVDTACSSSLVAVHLACQNLRAGRTRLALAGGVNVMLWPATTAAFSQVGMVSPDGRCRTFDASANGYVRGEGAGMVVLKRLGDAVADNDRVFAVIRGTAVNQDGRSNGLTAPNGAAQEAVIRAALADARVLPHQIGYLEAHGTGTALGDPVEVNALAAALCADRDADRPLILGSVKTNIGHLEAAAGIAGLIKVTLALYHREIPPHLHLREPSPYIDWATLPVRVATERTPWPAPAGAGLDGAGLDGAGLDGAGLDRAELGGAGQRFAGVSSFGFGGTNAHVILAEPPPATADGADDAATHADDAAARGERRLRLLTLSARTERALRTLAGGYADRIERTSSIATVDLCHTTNVRRARFAHRFAVPVGSTDEAVAALRAIAAGQRPELAQQGIAPVAGRRRIVFAFAGQGGQHIGIGRELYRSQPVFREAIHACAELFDPHHSWRLHDLLYPTGSGYPIDQTEYAQPALFAVQYALAQMWRSWGVQPDAVLGHSLGEYAAACVAGMLDLRTAVALIVVRGQLTQRLAPGGMMAACSAPAEQVAELLDGYGDRGAIAAVNGPQHTVISGEQAAVHEVLERLEAEFVLTRPLRVSYASHSPLVDPILDEFERAIAGHEFGAPAIPFMSTCTAGMFRSAADHDASYWRRQLREPVRLLDSVRALAADGYDTFLEIGPKDTLIEMSKRCLPKDEQQLWLRSLDPETDNWRTVLESVGALHVHGVDIDWPAFEGTTRPPVDLPTYPFERTRCWLDAEQVRQYHPRPEAVAFGAANVESA